MRFRMLFERSAVGIVAAAAVAAGTVTVIAAPVVAAQGGGTAQVCPFPLIGNQDITTRVDVDLPARLPIGQPSPEAAATVDLTLPTTTAQGLELVGAETLGGTITVPFEGRYSDGRTTAFSRTFTFQDVRVP